MTTAWIIILAVYLIGALVTYFVVKNWKHAWWEKAFFIYAWPGTLILYIIKCILRPKA